MDKNKLADLIKAVQSGSEEAFTELYNEFHNEIYYHIIKTLGSKKDPDLAIDLMQETFIEIAQTIDKLHDPAAFSAWSRKIAYHRCTAYFRKRHELLMDENEDGTTIFDNVTEDREEFIPGDALDKEDLKCTIREIIDSLPEEQRSAIMMRYFDELSVQEIADIQSTSEGTVKSRLNYGRKAIKKAVEDYEKKHDIKLHCAGVVPILLWLFRTQKRESFIAKYPSVASHHKISGANVKGSAIEKKVLAKALSTKIIAVTTAAAVSVCAIGAGIAAAVKNDKAVQIGAGEESYQQHLSDSNDIITEYVSNTSPEDFCGIWIKNDDTLVIEFQEITQRYYFTYTPAHDEPFSFFADFDVQIGVFRTPKGGTCGFIEEIDTDGNPVMNWRETDHSAWTFSCENSTLFWQTDETNTITFHREDNGEKESSAETEHEVYILDDYPAYVQKLGEYRDAILSADYNSDLYPTLNSRMLHYYHVYDQDVSFCYALEDIDGNGIPELLIGKQSSTNGTPGIIDLYSISDGAIIQYFDNPSFGEYIYLSILADGRLFEDFSLDAYSGGFAVHKITENSSSLTEQESYFYYIGDEEHSPPSSEYLDYDEYNAIVNQYEFQTHFSWSVIDS